MKNNKTIIFLLISPFLLSISNKQENKSNHIRTNGIEKIFGNDLKSDILSGYEVKFTYTGYVSFLGDAPDCQVGSGGKVTLTGILRGEENVRRSDDIYYEGTLQMDMNISICSVKRLTNGEDVLCSISVTGSGLVKTKLEIQFDGRGGYFQITDTTSRGFTKNVGGSCDPEQTDEERKMVPLQTIASVFNGLELPMLNQRTLQVGRYVDRVDQGETVVEVLRKVQ